MARGAPSPHAGLAWSGVGAVQGQLLALQTVVGGVPWAATEIWVAGGGERAALPVSCMRAHGAAAGRGGGGGGGGVRQPYCAGGTGAGAGHAERDTRAQPLALTDCHTQHILGTAWPPAPPAVSHLTRQPPAVHMS